MKPLKIIALLLFFVSFTQISKAQSANVPSEVISALNNGDAGKLASFMNNNVQLVVNNINEIYSKQQAVGIISDFFRRNSVSKFEVLHQGVKEAASFAIGTLYTSGGKYRVYVLTRKNGNSPVIQQLRIESNNE